MPDREWVEWNDDTATERPDLVEAVARFEGTDREADRAAAEWLRVHGLDRGLKTWLFVADDVLAGFYALGLGEVVLSSGDQRRAGVRFPRQGAVLLAWLAKAATAARGVGDEIFLHALGQASRIARHSDAQVFALDPYDDESLDFWLNSYPLRRSKTEIRSLPRLWMRIPD